MVLSHGLFMLSQLWERTVGPSRGPRCSSCTFVTQWFLEPVIAKQSKKSICWVFTVSYSLEKLVRQLRLTLSGLPTLLFLLDLPLVAPPLSALVSSAEPLMALVLSSAACGRSTAFIFWSASLASAAPLLCSLHQLSPVACML
eukprot:2649838-Amphidinium_carterae.1